MKTRKSTEKCSKIQPRMGLSSGRLKQLILSSWRDELFKSRFPKVQVIGETMRAYVAAKFKGSRNRKFLENICEAIESLNIQTFLFVRDVEKWGRVILREKELMQKAIDELRNSDILIVESSEKGVGIGIEAGLGKAFGKKIIAISKRKEISPTLKGISDYIVIYDSLPRLKRELRLIIKVNRKEDCLS